jgi:hypothetical protein
MVQVTAIRATQFNFSSQDPAFNPVRIFEDPSRYNAFEANSSYWTVVVPDGLPYKYIRVYSYFQGGFSYPSGTAVPPDGNVGAVVLFDSLGLAIAIFEADGSSSLLSIADLVAFPTDIMGLSDNFYGSAFNDIAHLGDGFDYASGAGGNDIIYGEGDDDFLDGGDGNDQLFGGTGDDSFFGGSGNDLIDGGDGIDWVSYGSDPGRTIGITANLQTGIVEDGLGDAPRAGVAGPRRRPQAHRVGEALAPLPARARARAPGVCGQQGRPPTRR